MDSAHTGLQPRMFHASRGCFMWNIFEYFSLDSQERLTIVNN